MTTEFQTPTDYQARTEDTAPTDYESTPGYREAVDRATALGEGGAIDRFVERLAEQVGAKASVRAVFGDPIERDGITIIPVAKVRWGFGGGAGRGPIAVGPGIAGDAGAIGGESDSGAGSGGGGGATADPLGYLEIGRDGATFREIRPAMPSPGFLLATGVAASLLIRAIARLIRR